MVLPENLECPTRPDGLLGPSGDNIKKPYCFAWKTAWQSVPGGNNGISHSICMKNHLLPECLPTSSISPQVLSSCWKRRWSEGCSNILWSICCFLFLSSLLLLMLFSRTGEAHRKTIWCNFSCFGKDSLTSTDCYQLVYRGGLYYTISSCSFGIWLSLITLPNTWHMEEMGVSRGRRK